MNEDATFRDLLIATGHFGLAALLWIAIDQGLIYLLGDHPLWMFLGFVGGGLAAYPSIRAGMRRLGK